MEDPLRHFQRWFAEAEAAGVPQREAMALATADARGRPSVRMVLLKGWTDRGLEFFTNRGSRKGLELSVNPQAAISLYWQPQGRAVRAAGPVRAMAARESRAYWSTRPLESQSSAWVSEQSRRLPSREALEARQREMIAKAGPEKLPLPPFWGGYRLRPEWVEFWEHRDDRLHRRLLFTRRRGGWATDELQP